ncbi:unnamed protein product [Durusdinium trenchii]
MQARLRPLPGEAVPPEAFQEVSRPLLLAATGDVLAADRTGQSCSDFCETRGASCEASDLLFVNRCEAMRVALFCERCERNLGSDQPAVASLRSSRSYGACLYNGDILHYPITCEASHRETRRLCVCRAPPRAGPRPAVEGDAGTTRVPSVVSKMLPGQAAQASEAETTSGWANELGTTIAQDSSSSSVSEAETTIAANSSSSFASKLGTTIARDSSSSSVSEAETTIAANSSSSFASKLGTTIARDSSSSSVSEAETTMAPDSSSSLAKELGTTIAPDTSSSSVSEAETTMAADLPSSLARSNESTRLRL